jgi:putative tricarboxylic transport membrane protein
MLLMGVLGYLMRKWAYDAAPLLLALVIGPKMEVAFRQSLMLSHGNFGVFVERPFSLVFLLATFLFLVLPALRFMIRRLGAGARHERGSG